MTDKKKKKPTTSMKRLREVKVLMKEAYLKGTPQAIIAKDLNALGYLTPYGYPWTQSTVSRFAIDNRVGRRTKRYSRVNTKPKRATVSEAPTDMPHQTTFPPSILTPLAPTPEELSVMGIMSLDLDWPLRRSIIRSLLT